MTERDKIKLSYEIAFFPPKLCEVWQKLKKDPDFCTEELGELLDRAEILHQRLPTKGYSSQVSLNRLALYQAKSRAFGIPSFIHAIRKRLNRSNIKEVEVPASWVRAIALPPFMRRGTEFLTTNQH